MDGNPNEVFKMILDMRTIYTKDLNQANNVNKQCNQIQTVALKLEQELQISNNKTTEAITLLEVQVANQIDTKKSLTRFKTSFPLRKTNLSSQLKNQHQYNKHQPLSIVCSPCLMISVQSLARLNQLRLVLP